MMRLPAFTYLAPRALDEAARMLADHGLSAMAVAGETDLYPNMKRRQFEPKVLVGLRGLRELQGVRGNERDGLTIGAGTVLRDLTAHPLAAAWFPVLGRAAELISNPQIRHMGTVGGNLLVDTRCNYYNMPYWWRKSISFCMKKDGNVCWVAPGGSKCWAISSSDLATVVIALDAKVRARAAEQVLIGQKLDGGVIDAAFKPAKPLDNTDLTLRYRKQMVRVYVGRALKELAGIHAEEPPSHI